MNADKARSGRQNYQGTTIRNTFNNCLKRNICKVTDINQNNLEYAFRSNQFPVLNW